MSVEEAPGAAQPEIRVDVPELRDNLTHYLAEVSQGRSVLVTAKDIVIAELRAPASFARLPRTPGAMSGRIWMAEDFDRWPADLLEAMEA